MPDRYTTDEAGKEADVTSERVRQIARTLGLTLERIGGADFLSLAQLKQVKKWVKENGYKKTKAEAGI